MAILWKLGLQEGFLPQGVFEFCAGLSVDVDIVILVIKQLGCRNNCPTSR